MRPQPSYYVSLIQRDGESRREIPVLHDGPSETAARAKAVVELQQAPAFEAAQVFQMVGGRITWRGEYKLAGDKLQLISRVKFDDQGQPISSSQQPGGAKRRSPRFMKTAPFREMFRFTVERPRGNETVDDILHALGQDGEIETVRETVTLDEHPKPVLHVLVRSLSPKSRLESALQRLEAERNRAVALVPMSECPQQQAMVAA